LTWIVAVLFDLGGTIVKTASVPETFRRILNLYGVESSLKEIERAHQIAEREISLEDYKLPYTEFWAKWNRLILQKLRVRKDIEELSRVIVEAWWDNADVELYPDVEKTIWKLKEMKVKIGVVTNGFRRDADEVLKRVGLFSVFDVIVGVDSVGKPKPYREIFLYATRKIGVLPSRTLFVGDSLEIDYFGALRSGLKALLIDRDNKVMKRNIKKIKRLDEVIEYI